MSRVKQDTLKEPEVVISYVNKVKRVYIVPTAHGITLNLDVELDCGGFTTLTGFTSFDDRQQVRVLKSDILYKLDGEKECTKEK